MSSYTIHINEEQRVMIEAALGHFISSAMPKNDHEAEEYCTLWAMIGDLPASEIATPGVTHGLCL